MAKNEYLPYNQLVSHYVVMSLIQTYLNKGILLLTTTSLLYNGQKLKRNVQI